MDIFFFTKTNTLMLIDHIDPPQLIMLTNYKIINSFEHVVQSMLNTCLFDVVSHIHTLPHITQI